MGIQFRLTVGDDRIELERGACSIVLDRTAATPSDYVVAANVSGSKALHDLLLSMAPSQMEWATGAVGSEQIEDTPLEQHIKELGKDIATGAVVPDTKVHVKFDRARWAGQAKATRTKAGDSQEAIGKAVGVTANTISMMETGSKNMGDATAIDIARRVVSHYSSSANEKPLPTRFGTVLRAARKAKHMTTDGLGEQVGLSRNYILKIEKDPFNGAPRATVEKIADFLGVKNIDRFYRQQRDAA